MCECVSTCLPRVCQQSKLKLEVGHYCRHIAIPLEPGVEPPHSVQLAEGLIYDLSVRREWRFREERTMFATSADARGEPNARLQLHTVVLLCLAYKRCSRLLTWPPLCLPAHTQSACHTLTMG